VSIDFLSFSIAWTPIPEFRTGVARRAIEGAVARRAQIIHAHRTI
jgi:hypothetical protein